MPNSDDKKRIRFIDSSYNTLFSIPDGGTITVTTPDGKAKDYECMYDDPTHFKAGGELWHIAQFAERMEKNQNRYMPKQENSKWPAYCYSVIPSSGELIVIHSGETGYYPHNGSVFDKQRNREIANALNQRIGVTRGMEEAMRSGSMFGWDKPIADPANYENDGTMKPISFYEGSFVERIRKQYPEGTRIVLDEMNDPYRKDMTAGLKGIVIHVDDQAQIHCAWENGSSLALIPGEDKFHRDTEQEQDIQPEEMTGDLEL